MTTGSTELDDLLADPDLLFGYSEMVDGQMVSGERGLGCCKGSKMGCGCERTTYVNNELIKLEHLEDGEWIEQELP